MSVENDHLRISKEVSKWNVLPTRKERHRFHKGLLKIETQVTTGNRITEDRVLHKDSRRFLNVLLKTETPITTGNPIITFQLMPKEPHRFHNALRTTVTTGITGNT